MYCGARSLTYCAKHNTEGEKKWKNKEKNERIRRMRKGKDRYKSLDNFSQT
jgi:hypothetical protein